MKKFIVKTFDGNANIAKVFMIMKYKCLLRISYNLLFISLLSDKPNHFEDQLCGDED